jgi:hypothetical protein
VSSGNQKLLLVSSRHLLEDFDAQSIEFTIGSDGFTQITGFTGQAMVQVARSWHSAPSRRGILPE